MNRQFLRRAAKVSSIAIAAMMSLNAGIVPVIAQTQSVGAYPERPKAPKGAPNIIVIMTDDVGFAASSTFGGPVPTPVFDALADKGARYNRFNTTAMCSPTRAALLTGRNPHEVGFGVISEEAAPAPGYNSVIPRSAATFAEVLGMNGYNTAMFGKHHNAPLWEDTPVGPFDHWPTGLGFDYFYGFLGGATNQFAPALYENREWREAPQDDPNYILDRDLADHAIKWMNTQRSVSPDAPFLIYYAPGSAHSPHQAPPDWIARFKGHFDQGWDKVRDASFARQKKTGVIPSTAALTPRPPVIPAWDSLTPDAKRVEARMMEIYAAQLAFADDQIGRLIQAVKDNGDFDNTLIVFIQGDNGASMEGSPIGTMDEIARGKNAMPDTLQDQLARIDDFGTKHSWNNYGIGWAWAMNTPFQWGKAIASHLGGVRNGMVVSWPRGLQKPGQMRTQFTNVTDIAPTLYEAAGIAIPESVHGVKQMPLAGTSLAYTFRQPNAASRDEEQYWELRENIAFYEKGWLAATTPRVMPWDKEAPPASGTPVEWQLYDLNSDFSQSRDLAAKNPAKLAELKQAYAAVAARNQVGLPAGVSAAAARPFLSNGQTRFVYRNSDQRLSRYSFANIMNRSWQVTADIVVPETGGDGALVAQGSRLGGWGLLMMNGRPAFLYNASILDRDKTRITGGDVLKPGAHKIVADIVYDGGGRGMGASVRILIDGREVSRGRVPRTIGALLVSEGGASIGRDYGTTLSDDYASPFVYPGTIDKVVIDVGPTR
ncbi:arylsulfatase [Sphingomonas sp. So64.6b]|uniref:arylsulfatase n=1 Tax=Sphingomonas sp. So64.6b TaxID=2997354 RepID=UPI0016048DCA|nr:arylsulfatase [Sphingomonas sp. So64.6b]QNA82658.1 arylsulfatase [Sphingomonas sp. So64.6b]